MTAPAEEPATGSSDAPDAAWDDALPDAAAPDTTALDAAGPDAAAKATAAKATAATVTPPVGAEQPWRRLATGMLMVEPAREIIRFIPMLILLVFAGRAGDSGPPWGLIGTVAVIVLGVSRWLTTRYRITPTVVEVRKGLLQRKHLTVPRDRVRTVDVSAHPLQRLLRLVKVEVGTGTSHHADRLVLDGLPAAAAGPLRVELLHRAGAGAATTTAVTTGTASRPEATRPTTPGTAEPAGADVRAAGWGGGWDSGSDGEEIELARLNPRWVGYAPATLSGVVTAAFLIGLAWRIINEARIDPIQLSAVHRILRYLQSTPLWLDLVQGALVAIVVVTVLSVAGYVLSFWGFRLTRHPGGTLQVSRGLLTTRATSIEERRLRGVERFEPLLLRWVGGARLQAIATGLHRRGSERGGSLLVPPAPLATVIEVESAVLGSAVLSRAALTSHGPAARRRRYTRALGPSVLLVAALFALAGFADWPSRPAWTSLLLVPLAALLAADRYRSLGHALVEGVLISRVGSLVRRRSALAVPGVVGVTVRQSVFQRRSGLISLTATTAAGAQRYPVSDLPQARAIELLGALVPQCSAFLVDPLPATQGDPHHASVAGAAPAERTGPTTQTFPGRALLRDPPGVSRLPG